MVATTYGFGNGLVPAHRHPNGGGWVADTARVDESAYVGLRAQVYGEAQVYGGARVCGGARVYGEALVYGEARVYGEAQVYGGARVYGEALVYGEAQVYGGALVYGEARVISEIPHGYNGLTFQCGWYAATINDDKIISGCHSKTPDEWLEYLLDGPRDGIPEHAMKYYIEFFKWAKTLMSKSK